MLCIYQHHTFSQNYISLKAEKGLFIFVLTLSSAKIFFYAWIQPGTARIENNQTGEPSRQD